MQEKIDKIGDDNNPNRDATTKLTTIGFTIGEEDCEENEDDNE